MFFGNDVQKYYKHFQPTAYIDVDVSEKFWQYMEIEVGSVDNENKIKETDE